MVPAPLAATAARLSDAVVALGEAAATLRPLGPWAGALIAGIGLAALTIGARQRRMLALWGGAAVGALAALAVGRLVQAHLGLSPSTVVWIGGAAGAALCAAFPALFPPAAGALAGAVVGGELPLSSVPGVPAAAGAAVGAIAGVASSRLVAAGFASFFGGALVVLGLSTALGGHPLAHELADRPFALAAVALVLGIAGTAFQGARRPPAEPPAGARAAGPPGPWPDRPMP